jgi:uncharacterized protein (TIGR00299 family) protein
MSRTLWFDSVGGASGDMILASLIDLGVNPDTLQSALSSLGDFHIRLEVSRVSDHGMSGTRVAVHAHDHHDAHHHTHSHSHRGLSDISTIINESPLPTPVKQQAIAVFTRLAEAEAAIHQTTPEAIHFHEVGALDAIADIVGSCLALSLLGVDRIGFAPLPAGHGTITCAHGTLPNPAPATVALLRGYPMVRVDEPFELVTPTAAALLSTWAGADASRWTPSSPAASFPPENLGIVGQVGHAFGHRKLNNRPNLLRATLMESASRSDTTDNCLVMETNIDDTTPELVGALTQKLLASGAFDVFTTSIQMKKQRPGMLLTVLCAPSRRDALLDLIFTESTTFGVREHLTRRTMLERRWEPVTTPYGQVRVKLGSWKGRAVTASPEYDDCLSLAEKTGIPLRTIFESARSESRKFLT